MSDVAPPGAWIGECDRLINRLELRRVLSDDRRAWFDPDAVENNVPATTADLLPPNLSGMVRE